MPAPASPLRTDVTNALGLPTAVDWVAGVVCVVLVGWFVLSNWDKFERVAGWLSANRRRREAVLDERLTKLEKGGYLGGEYLHEQFAGIAKRLDLNAAELLAGKEARHAAQHEYENLLSEVRRNRLDIEKLQHLEPRLTEAEKTIAVIIQKMSDLEKGQERILDSADETRRELAADRDTILRAIHDLR